MRVIKKFDEGIQLDPSTTEGTREGEIWVDSNDNKVKIFLDGVVQEFTTTNSNTAAGISYDNDLSELSAINTQDAIDELLTNLNLAISQLPVATSLQFIQQPTDVVVDTVINPPVTVEVRDQYGNLFPSTIQVNIGNSTGVGTMTGTTTVNAVGGVATFNDLQLDTIETSGLAAFASGILSGAASDLFQVTSPASVATALVITQQPTNTVPDTVITPAITVEIRDQYNVLISDTSNVTVSILSGTGTLSGTTTVSAVGGIATFNDLEINSIDDFTLEFTSGVLSSATSDSFYVGNWFDLSSQTDFNTTPTSVERISGGALYGAVQSVSSIDSGDFEFSFTHNGPPNQVVVGIDSPTYVSGDNDYFALDFGFDLQGTGYTIWESGNVGSVIPYAPNDSFKIKVESGVITYYHNDVLSYTSASTFTGYPAKLAGLLYEAGCKLDNIYMGDVKVATSLVITQQPTDVDTNTNITPAITVEIRDQFGDLLPSTAQVDVAISSGTGTLSGDVDVNAVGGVATFSDLQIDAADTFTLEFTSAGLPSIPSTSFTVSGPLTWNTSLTSETFTTTPTQVQWISGGGSVYGLVQSDREISSGDFTLEYRHAQISPGSGNIGSRVGVDLATFAGADDDYNFLDYAFYIVAETLQIYEAGSLIQTVTTSYGQSGKYDLKIEVIGGTVKYFWDGVLQYTSLVPLSGTAKASLLMKKGILDNIVFESI